MRDFIQKILSYLCFPIPDEDIEQVEEEENKEIIECNGTKVEIFPNFFE